MRSPVFLVLVVGLWAALASVEAFALDGCKASINKKTGEIEVSARNVVGEPLWGGGPPDSANTPFQGLADCQQKGRLRRCLLGNAGTYSAKRTPSSCTLSLADDAGTCQVHIQGCSAASTLSASVSVSASSSSIARSHGAVSVSKLGTGEYDVRFDRAIRECFPVATRISQDSISTCIHCGTTDHDVLVRLWTHDGLLSDFNGSFYLVLHCP